MLAACRRSRTGPIDPEDGVSGPVQGPLEAPSAGLIGIAVLGSLIPSPTDAATFAQPWLVTAAGRPVPYLRVPMTRCWAIRPIRDEIRDRVNNLIGNLTSI
jgi:hypothetical protein